MAKLTIPLASLSLQVGGGLETVTLPEPPEELEVKVTHVLLQPAPQSRHAPKARKRKDAGESRR